MTHEELKAKVQALADAASSNETVKAFANELFGKEAAHAMLKHAEEIKAQGAEFCDCPGCIACKDIIDHLDEI